MERRHSAPSPDAAAFPDTAGGVFLLAMVALLMLGSLERVLEPQPIHYKQAILVASIALVVNTISALLLELAQHRPRVGDQGYASFGNVACLDFNSQSFYMNIVADVATSLLALTALIGGGIYGLTWMDPVAGAVQCTRDRVVGNTLSDWCP
jgi:Co/Zn/Cd efflux system component